MRYYVSKSALTVLSWFEYFFISLDFDTVNVKRKKTDVNVNINEKNPISILNELRLGLKYEVIEQTGPSHNPMFKVSVVVDGQTYYGIGNSKKAAKCSAATEALKSFIQFPNNGTITSTNKVSHIKMDFTSDQIVNKKKHSGGGSSKKPGAKVPVMLLNELYPGAQYDCSNDESDPYARFKVVVTIGNETFSGTGKHILIIKCIFIYLEPVSTIFLCIRKNQLYSKNIYTSC